MIDRERYAQMLSPLLGRASAYARSILRDRHSAEDAVQQAALRGLEKLNTFDVTRPFKAWWFAILRNCCIDMLRSRKAFQEGDLQVDVPDSSSEEDWSHLAAAMEQLSADHRDVLRLKYFADHSYDEIAETLRIPKGTVMSRLHLARKALAARMMSEDL